ncbi:transcription factor MYB80 [Triticum aestivum]|nr:transcription factor MYB80-like [Triticum aestivum]
MAARRSKIQTHTRKKAARARDAPPTGAKGGPGGGGGADMGRIPCCEKENVKRGQWTDEEEDKLLSYIMQYGARNWRLIPKNAGLQRCWRSCRLRWANYLRLKLKHGEITDAEEQCIIKLHSVLSDRWAVIAAQLPGRTSWDVKNHWNIKLKKKLSGMETPRGAAALQEQQRRTLVFFFNESAASNLRRNRRGAGGSTSGATTA